ncbi:TY1B-ER1, partial [Symbiodinium microadriaticum]
DVLPEGSGTYDNDPLYEPDMTDEEAQLPDHPEGEITNEEAADLMDVVAAPVQEGARGGEIIVELGGGLVKVQKPCASRDDVTEVSLDLGLTYEGMIKELKALESLSVGDMMWHVDPKQRVISTRWVVAAKNERIDGKETPIVRCRIVARDYSTGPSASQLGISSPTASGEALKLFLAAIGAEGFNILGLDVSTASAALHWTRHLSGLLGYFKNKRVFVLSYVDDLLLAGASTEDLYEMVELLRKELKLKVTADLAQGDLKFGMDPGYMQDVLEEYKLENAKGLPTPPCLRDLLDKSLDEASLQVPLTPEAAARYRRALGKLSWLSATRGDLVYYISVLARAELSFGGGCPYQRLNLSKYGTEYQKHLDGLWAVHRKLWAVVKTLSNLSDHWAVEWPARCAYWKQTESFFEGLSYPVYTSYVEGCATGLLGNDGLPIAKRWRVMVTNARFLYAAISPQIFVFAAILPTEWTTTVS